jgi:carbonic anhydrase
MLSSRRAPGRLADAGHAIQVDAAAAASIRSRHFRLTQSHFHSPGEHTIDGKPCR